MNSDTKKIIEFIKGLGGVEVRDGVFTHGDRHIIIYAHGKMEGATLLDFGGQPLLEIAKKAVSKYDAYARQLHFEPTHLHASAFDEYAEFSYRSKISPAVMTITVNLVTGKVFKPKISNKIHVYLAKMADKLAAVEAELLELKQNIAN